MASRSLKNRATGVWEPAAPKINHSPQHETTRRNIEHLLSRLDGVHQTAPNRWLARCPAHDDRSPSLSFKLTEDDRVLAHDLGGCSADAVLDAMGMDISELFPQRHGRDFDPTVPRPTPPRFRPSELLHLAAFESRIAAVAAGDIANGRVLSDDDYRRVSIAAEVLDAIVHEACRYGR